MSCGGETKTVWSSLKLIRLFLRRYSGEGLLTAPPPTTIDAKKLNLNRVDSRNWFDWLWDILFVMSRSSINHGDFMLTRWRSPYTNNSQSTTVTISRVGSRDGAPCLNYVWFWRGLNWPWFLKYHVYKGLDVEFTSLTENSLLPSTFSTFFDSCITVSKIGTFLTSKNVQYVSNKLAQIMLKAWKLVHKGNFVY